MNIHSLRPRDHEDAGRVAISWLAGAITTPAGLERVKGLLREYGDGEQLQSAAQGRPTVSYQLLWDALGISR